MKIAISSEGPHLDSHCDPRFARCNFFIIYDLENEKFSIVENPYKDLHPGAGFKTAKLISERNVDAVISGKVGPHAFGILKSAGIKIYIIDGGFVREVIELFKKGKLKIQTKPAPGRGLHTEGKEYGWNREHHKNRSIE